MLLAVPKWLSVAVAALTVPAFTPATVLAPPATTLPSRPPTSPNRNRNQSSAPKSATGTAGSIRTKTHSLGLLAGEGRRARCGALATLRSAPEPGRPAHPDHDRLFAAQARAGRRGHGLLPEGAGRRIPIARPRASISARPSCRSGEPAKAKEQLAEIAKRCGVACEDYQLLADEIAKFENKAG